MVSPCGGHSPRHLARSPGAEAGPAPLFSASRRLSTPIPPDDPPHNERRGDQLFSEVAQHLGPCAALSPCVRSPDFSEIGPNRSLFPFFVWQKRCRNAAPGAQFLTIPGLFLDILDTIKRAGAQGFGSFGPSEKGRKGRRLTPCPSSSRPSWANLWAAF